MEVEEANLSFLKKWILNVGIFIAIIISITSCSQDSDIISASTKDQLNDYLINNFIDSTVQSKESEDIQKDSCMLNYIQNIDEYTAGSINFDSGSFLKIPAKSLIAPEGFSEKDIVITMVVRKDSIKNELNFMFGPPGCEFKKPVKLCLSWKQLNCKRATLYYLDESGNRIEHLSDQVDHSKKRMILMINHFSRYAVAYSN